ncbi:polysaccharide lyase family 14 protein [Gymnopilus junonius]|uniref:Polysaccharide lyase family 14 protein n=1 Tax=Gymnopilus junonius TaxID=109634 RepID=A0A9P5NZQ8_GYMJU|nr:polysaccharide lyase family 14 protein [Gymnopilus junonius]
MAKRNTLDLSHLIPYSDFITGFTTCELIDHPNIESVILDDHQLGIHKVSSATTHHVVQPPASSGSTAAPKAAWEAFYPEGSINPGGEIPGGFGFYLTGPSSFAKRLETASEATFSYRLMLQEDWEWVKGGKLLEFVLGGVNDLAYGCTGGREDKRCQCFDLRAMWRANAVGELYAYLPLTGDNATQLSWVSIAFRVKLNDVGSANGEIELWVDGNSVIKVDELTIRTNDSGRIKGMHFQTFFGGHGKDWASPKDQRAWFSDVTGVISRSY